MGLKNPTIEYKLKVIAHYLAQAELFSKSASFYIYVIYFYIGEILSVIVGVGISSPVTDLIVKAFGKGKDNSPGTSLVGNPMWVNVGIVALLLIIIFAKVFIKRNDMAKKDVFMKEYDQECQQIRQKVEQALQDKNPISNLNNILKGDCHPLADKCIKAGVWPDYSRSVADLESRENQIVGAWCGKYESHWIVEFERE